MPIPQKPGTVRSKQGPNAQSQLKAPAVKGAKVSSKKKDDEVGTETGDGDEWIQGKTLVKPPDQLDLTEAHTTVDI